MEMEVLSECLQTLFSNIIFSYLCFEINTYQTFVAQTKLDSKESENTMFIELSKMLTKTIGSIDQSRYAPYTIGWETNPLSKIVLKFTNKTFRKIWPLVNLS